MRLNWRKMAGKFGSGSLSLAHARGFFALEIPRPADEDAGLREDASRAVDDLQTADSQTDRLPEVSCY
jgi:hypothetical protein